MLVQMESSLVGFHSKGCRMVFCMLWHKFVDQNRWKVDGKNCENYSDLIFAWGSPIWQTNTWNRWCLCVVPFFIGKSHVPPGSRFPPPLCFPGGQNVHEIHHLCELSLQGLLAVLVESKLLIPMVFSWEDVDINLIKGIQVWWKLKISKNDEMMSFFSQVHGVLFVFCEASQTTSHQLRVPALERTRRCCNLRTTWNTIRHWTILRLGKRKDSTSNLLTCAYLDDWNSSGRIRAFVSTMFRLVKSVRCAGSLTFTG